MTDPRSTAVLGRGPLADSLPFTRIGSVAALSSDIHNGAVAVDIPLQEIHARTAAEGIPWLPIRSEPGWITIGPLTLPGTPGCALCVARRRHRNREDTTPRQELRRRWPQPAGNMVIPPTILNTVGTLVMDQFAPTNTRTVGAVLRMSFLDGTMRRHPFLADPSCPRCADLPPDTELAAKWPRVRLPKATSDTFRLRDINEQASQLRDLYVDAETGLISSLDSAWLGGVSTAVARRATGQDADDSQHGYGRAEDSDTAKVMAVAEALERQAAERPLGRRTVIRGSYAELAERALDPRTLGTPADELYSIHGYPYTLFSPHHETNWVWAHSFGEGKALLVPESVAYYGVDATPAWFGETSNGCALGSTIEEAVLYGLLEVAERDAFLMAWYGRLPLPHVDLESAADRRIPVLAGLIEQLFDCEVTVLAAFMEQRIPAVVTLARHRDEKAGPASAFAAAAHLAPERAILSALRELGPLLYGLRARYTPDVVAPLLDDPSLLISMDQHAALYTHPGSRSRTDFLTLSNSRVTLDSLTAQASWPKYDDLSADLDELTARYLATGLDVIAVDTTSTEQSAGGLRSAKVLVPGTVPMAFGHPYRRTANLPRLLTVPEQLGYRVGRLSPDELNADPHPFS
ncbi:TOMM precursor leader peptide-binding protein [Streptomyces sp. NPDC088354]|uniref:TOMM precursor leader peptide-binding protein n=1 Tax=Streptomyces sp. NPDC088354 TaxID=3365856 RepID=UPI0038124BAC